MNTLQKTRKILNEYGITANKRFGQNFLIDDNILDKIVKVADITKDDLVIEIGPGLGNLTEYILSECKYSLLIEIDTKMIEILQNRLCHHDNFMLINEDVLKIDIDAKIEEIEKVNNCTYTNVKVVANLPYYITTPIIFQLLQKSKRIKQVTVMVQKEVAERMVAKVKTKDYGILTLMVKYFSNANIDFIVPKESFIPSPNVTSAIITLKKNNNYEIKNEEILFGIIHGAFSQRRKKMINALNSYNKIQLKKEDLISVFKKLQINENTRAEELELEDYIKITQNIKDKE